MNGLHPGEMLGAHQIQRPLGRGGMGVVYLAHDTTLHRQVALKVLERVVDEGSSRASLLREARNAAVLNHPNMSTTAAAGRGCGSTTTCCSSKRSGRD